MICVVRCRCPSWCPGAASWPGWWAPQSSFYDKLWNGILWPPDVKSCLNGKGPDDGKGWGQEEKGARKDEMIRWHQWLNGHESGQTPKYSGGQEPGVLQSMEWQKVRHDLVTKQQQFFFFTSFWMYILYIYTYIYIQHSHCIYIHVVYIYSNFYWNIVYLQC